MFRNQKLARREKWKIRDKNASFYKFELVNVKFAFFYTLEHIKHLIERFEVEVIAICID